MSAMAPQPGERWIRKIDDAPMLILWVRYDQAGSLVKVRFKVERFPNVCPAWDGDWFLEDHYRAKEQPRKPDLTEGNKGNEEGRKAEEEPEQEPDFTEGNEGNQEQETEVDLETLPRAEEGAVAASAGQTPHEAPASPPRAMSGQDLHEALCPELGPGPMSPRKKKPSRKATSRALAPAGAVQDEWWQK